MPSDTYKKHVDIVNINGEWDHVSRDEELDAVCVG